MFCRLLLKAGCRWYGICTFWVENLLFEVILSQAYFGQKPEEHVKTIKKCCLEIKNDDLWEKCITKTNNAFFSNFSRSSRARAGPIWALMGPYGPEKSRKIRRKFGLLGAFKGPCTLPQVTGCLKVPWRAYIPRLNSTSDCEVWNWTKSRKSDMSRRSAGGRRRCSGIHSGSTAQTVT